MKALTFCLIGLFFFSNYAFAQVDAEAPKAPKILNTDGKDEIFILDLNLDSWLDAPAGIDLELFKSRGISFKFFSDKNIAKSNFYFAYGLGLTATNVHHNGFIAYDSTGANLIAFDPAADYKINKLSLSFIEIPLELRYRSQPVHKSNRIKVAAGFKGGLLLSSHTKFKDDDNIFKVKKIDKILPYQYGLTARIGYGKYSLSGYYGLSTVFEDGKGPEITPYSIGISIAPY